MADRQQLEMAIAAQEALRGTVPDDVIDMAVGALRRQLDPLGAAAQRRRQVTVLFADVSGFTAMSETMDAELVANRMNDIWARLDVVLTQHGGRIDKHIGDAVMAVWGADIAEEDDPERAVLAGLALQDTLAAFTADEGVAVAMRVGISTGPALVGAMGTTSEQTAMGDTVNLASRLEHLAPVGSVLIAHDTYRTVRGVFDVRPEGELTVKGRSAPVRAYVVQRAKPRAFRMATRGVEGVETRTIGRDDELAALQEAYSHAAEQGWARFVTVVADAGAGKSRLLYEFLNWVELEPSEAFLFTGRALANRQQTALGLFRDVTATRFAIQDSDAPAVVASKLREGFAGRLSPAQADVVGHWLGFDLSLSEAVKRLLGSDFAATARTHLVEFFGSLAASKTIVLALEDLHWADDESLDLLLELVAELSNRHLFVLGLARPVLFDRRRDWPGGVSGATRLDLSPLSEASSRELVHEVLQRVASLPEELVELVVDRAEGNAFYVEELVKMLIDDGVIDASVDDVWQVALDRLHPSAIPPTLTGVLQARLDALATDERRALQCASIVGRVFWDAAVASLAPEIDSIDASLDGARRRELVYGRDRSAFEGTAEYFFKHALLCDVTYETVLLRERQALHASVAAWLEAVAGERIAEYREMVAAHQQAAGQPGRAALHLWRVGQSYLETGTPAAARRALDAAVGLWAAAHEEPPAEALAMLAETCLRLDDLDAAQGALAAATRLATTPGTRADILYLSSWAASTRGDLELERSLLHQALPLAEVSGGRPLARTLLGLVWSDAQIGALDDAHRHAERSLLLSEQLGDSTGTMLALGAEAMVAGEQGDFQASQAFVDRQASIAEASGNLDQQAKAHGNLAVVLHFRGDTEGVRSHYDAAAEHYRRAIVLHQRLGEPVGEIRQMANLVQLDVRLGRDDEARELLREALSAAVSIGLPPLQNFCLQMEADRLVTRGEVDLGLAYLGLVLAHPSAGAIDRNEVDRILARTGLSSEAITAGLAAGAHLDLDTVVRELLAEQL